MIPHTQKNCLQLLQSATAMSYDCQRFHSDSAQNSNGNTGSSWLRYTTFELFRPSRLGCSDLNSSDIITLLASKLPMFPQVKGTIPFRVKQASRRGHRALNGTNEHDLSVSLFDDGPHLDSDRSVQGMSSHVPAHFSVLFLHDCQFSEELARSRE